MGLDVSVFLLPPQKSAAIPGSTKEAKTHLGKGNTAVLAVSTELSEKDLRVLLRQDSTMPLRCHDEFPFCRLTFVPIDALLMQSAAEVIESMLPSSLNCGV